MAISPSVASRLIDLAHPAGAERSEPRRVDLPPNQRCAGRRPGGANPAAFARAMSEQ
jgi:hypothetical protein